MKWYHRGSLIYQATKGFSTQAKKTHIIHSHLKQSSNPSNQHPSTAQPNHLIPSPINTDTSTYPFIHRHSHLPTQLFSHMSQATHKQMHIPAVSILHFHPFHPSLQAHCPSHPIPTHSHTHMVSHPSTPARGYPFVFYTKVALQGGSEALVSRCYPYSPTRYTHAVNLILPLISILGEGLRASHIYTYTFA